MYPGCQIVCPGKWGRCLAHAIMCWYAQAPHLRATNGHCKLNAGAEVGMQKCTRGVERSIGGGANIQFRGRQYKC